MDQIRISNNYGVLVHLVFGCFLLKEYSYNGHSAYSVPLQSSFRSLTGVMEINKILLSNYLINALELTIHSYKLIKYNSIQYCVLLNID